MGEFGMARKRHSDEECQKVLRHVELDLAGGADVSKACRSAFVLPPLKLSPSQDRHPPMRHRKKRLSGCSRGPVGHVLARSSLKTNEAKRLGPISSP